ncbi:MAG: EAL domain-containing protein [Gammaproteobacteria bacterium]
MIFAPVITLLPENSVDQLKIDQKFIHDISTNTNDAVIVDPLLAMAQHLGLSIVAEGVETLNRSSF